jgi:hypothetical protein
MVAVFMAFSMLRIWNYGYAVSFALVAFLSNAYLLLLKPAYFYIRIDRHLLTIRYYHVIKNLFRFSVPQVLEINQRDFKGYEVLGYNYGLSQELILYVSQGGQSVRYEPISISLLDKPTKQALIEILEGFKQ